MDNSKDKEQIFDVASVFMHSHATSQNMKMDTENIIPDEIYKKIVVYIQGEENIKHINSLTIQERNKLINEIMEISRTKTFFQIKQELIRGYIKQLIISIITIAVMVPLLLVVINKSYQYTVHSYKISENNFRKLYERPNLKILKQKNQSQQYPNYGNNSK